MYFTKYSFWDAKGSLDILAKDGASLTKDEDSTHRQNATKRVLCSVAVRFEKIVKKN